MSQQEMKSSSPGKPRSRPRRMQESRIKWSGKEVTTLQKVAEEQKRKEGYRSWTIVAESLPGRSARQCSNRFYNTRRETRQGEHFIGEQDVSI